MFIFTTKFNKKKAVLAVLILAAVIIAIIVIAGSIRGSNVSNAKETASLSAVVKNNDQRVNYLSSLGWEIDKDPLEEQKVVIPREFSEVYKKYNEIQKAQGFDLAKYGGIEAQRYTYKVLNYPGSTGNVVADIIVYRNQIIAGDVQSNAFDGFMVGLKYPKAVQPTASAQPKASAQPTASAQPITSASPKPVVSPNAANPNAASPNAANPSVKPNAVSPAASAKPNSAASSQVTQTNAAKTANLTSDSSAAKK